MAVACACLAVGPIAAAAPAQPPDVIPGIPNRHPVARVFTQPPLVVWMDTRPGCPRLVAGPEADRGPRALLEGGEDCPLSSVAPSELAVTTRHLATSELFLVELRRHLPAPGELRHHFLVRRGGERTELLCRFATPEPSGSLRLEIVQRQPLRFEVSSGGERLPYALEPLGFCRPTLPSHDPTDFAYENAFAHARMLFGLEQWGEAGDAYARLVHMRAGGRHTEEAALAAVRARSNYLDLQCFSAEGNLEPQPIEGALARRISSLDDYLRLFAGSPRAVEMTYRKAEDLYGCNHLEQADALFKSIAGGHPGHPLAARARERSRLIQADIQRRNALRRGGR